MTRGGLALLSVMLVIAISVTVTRCSEADASAAPEPHDVGDRFPVLIVRHAYDGVVMHEGGMLDFAYGEDGLYVEMIDGGDGIFRSNFEARE